jgi:pimeloyl-ACP methyl ester carboxylesterase
MAPVARELARTIGVLEPLQTKATLEGQVQELREVLEKNAGLPVTLVGFSWGAFLSFILTARYPALVSRLILVSSGPFEQQYAEGIFGERLKRLGEAERIEIFHLIDVIGGSVSGDKDKSLARFGELCAKADTFAPLPAEKEPEPLAVSEESNRRVWAEAEKLRISGELLSMGRQIDCPLVAIHGDYDPHPAEGVREPLSRVLRDFKFVRLEKCGHEPWREKFARERFFQILRNELE